MSRTLTHSERVLRRILWGQAAAFALTALAIGLTAPSLWPAAWVAALLVPPAVLLAYRLPRHDEPHWIARYQVAATVGGFVTFVPGAIGLYLSLRAADRLLWTDVERAALAG